MQAYGSTSGLDCQNTTATTRVRFEVDEVVYGDDEALGSAIIVSRLQTANQTVFSLDSGNAGRRAMLADNVVVEFCQALTQIYTTISMEECAFVFGLLQPTGKLTDVQRNQLTAVGTITDVVNCDIAVSTNKRLEEHHNTQSRPVRSTSRGLLMPTDTHCTHDTVQFGSNVHHCCAKRDLF